MAPDRFLAGQESAAVNTINGRKPATPTFVRIRTVRDQGVAGRPTLVQNVETLAHVALIARFGAEWFRDVGTAGSPGTSLLTVTGRWAEPRIVEVPLGDHRWASPRARGRPRPSIQGVLLGGYGGGWLPTAQALAMPLTEEAARSHGSSLGAGVRGAAADAGCARCPRSAGWCRYMEGQGAGPVRAVRQRPGPSWPWRWSSWPTGPDRCGAGWPRIPALCDLVEGRGACRHPDGVARFVRTALQVFGDHAAAPRPAGVRANPTRPFLPVPSAPTRQSVKRR